MRAGTPSSFLRGVEAEEEEGDGHLLAALKSSLTLWQSQWEREGKSPFPVRSGLALLQAPSPAEGPNGSCPRPLGSSHQFCHQPSITLLRVRSITKIKISVSPIQGNQPPFPSHMWRWGGLINHCHAKVWLPQTLIATCVATALRSFISPLCSSRPPLFHEPEMVYHLVVITN